MIPVVETSNLRLRGHNLLDFEGYADFWAGPRAAKFGGPFSRKQSWESFLCDAGHWAICGFGQWIVALKQSDQAIGWVGFIRPDHYDEPELGWTLFDAFEGKGLAYEASKTARDFGQAHFNIVQPVSYIETWNHRSVRLAERLGAIREDTRDNGDGPFHIYRHAQGGLS